MDLVGSFILFLLGLVVLFALLRLRPRMRVVREEERLVVYRLGRFYDVLGPGPVWLRGGGLNTIERTLNARNEPLDSSVDGLLIYGIPFGLSFNLWIRFDPKATVCQDLGRRQAKERLMHVAFLSDSERRDQMEIELREAVQGVLAKLQREHQLPTNATLIDRILPVIPHGPMSEAMVIDMRAALISGLASLGVVLDTNHPIKIVRLHLSEDLIRGFGRDRTLTMLRQRCPGVPDDRLLQMVGGIEGWSDVDFKEIGLWGNAAGTVEERMINGSTMTRVVATPIDQAQTNHADRQEAGAPVPQTSPRLSKMDLAVLKRVPRQTSMQLKSTRR